MEPTHTLSIFSDGSIREKPNLELAYVKPDWETVRWAGEPNHIRPVAPDPGIFPVSITPEVWPQTDMAWFPERWQWFHCDLLAMQMYGKLLRYLTPTQRAIIIKVFQSTTKSDRAYNNFNGTDIKNCYPCGKTDRGEDAKWESLITCVNNVSILDRKKVITGKNSGIVFVKLDSFQINSMPPRVTKELLLDPRVHYAKIVNPGRYVTNFWFSGWQSNLPLPVPFLTNGYHWYPEHELRLL